MASWWARVAVLLQAARLLGGGRGSASAAADAAAAAVASSLADAGAALHGALDPIQPEEEEEGEALGAAVAPKDDDDRHQYRRSLAASVGTPTGGGKYPFLVAVRWRGGVQDPNETKELRCQGTMVAPDVVLVTGGCRPDGEPVLVGDPRAGTTGGPFAQLRNVTWNVTSDDTRGGVVSHPEGKHHLFQIEPVSFPGFEYARIGRSPAAVGQKVRVVGYRTSEAGAAPYPRQAYEAELPVAKTREDSFKVNLLGDPCWGDRGAPVLSLSMKLLVGITRSAYCTARGSALRVTHIADWIERNVCALSAKKERIPFCPDLVCPSDARLLGYPWALLPNGTGSVVGIRGFVPVKVTQWPPPGTPLWRNTTTNVTISAFDATGGKLECVWRVLVAPLVALGRVAIDLPNGTYTRSGQFRRDDRALSGRVYKMSCQAGDRIRGRGSRVDGGLTRGTKLTGRPLTLNENRINGSVRVPNVPIRFQHVELNALSDVQVQVNVTKNARENQITYKVFGQVKEYLL